MIFPFWNLLGYQLQVFRQFRSVSRYIVHCAPSLFVAVTSNRPKTGH